VALVEQGTPVLSRRRDSNNSAGVETGGGLTDLKV